MGRGGGGRTSRETNNDAIARARDDLLHDREHAHLRPICPCRPPFNQSVTHHMHPNLKPRNPKDERRQTKDESAPSVRGTYSANAASTSSSTSGWSAARLRVSLSRTTATWNWSSTVGPRVCLSWRT